jgi:hypothetical protein
MYVIVGVYYMIRYMYTVYDVTVPENKDSLMRSLRAPAWQTVIASYYTSFLLLLQFFTLDLIIPSKIVFLSKLIEDELMKYGHTNM